MSIYQHITENEKHLFKRCFRYFPFIIKKKLPRRFDKVIDVSILILEKPYSKFYSSQRMFNKDTASYFDLKLPSNYFDFSVVICASTVQTYKSGIFEIIAKPICSGGKNH